MLIQLRKMKWNMMRIKIQKKIKNNNNIIKESKLIVK